MLVESEKMPYREWLRKVVKVLKMVDERLHDKLGYAYEEYKFVTGMAEKLRSLSDDDIRHGFSSYMVEQRSEPENW